MSRRPLWLVSMLLAVSGCSPFGVDSGPDQIVEPVGTDVASVHVDRERQVRFTVMGFWWSGCGVFSRFDIRRADGGYAVHMFGEQPADAVCLAVNQPITATGTLEVPRAGAYTISFWRGDEASLDTTIVVP